MKTNPSTRAPGWVCRFFLIALTLLWSAQLSAAGWTRAEWRGEKAWESVSKRGWRAVVSEERARLIALLPPDGGGNLLFAELKDQFSWGGHRFWLGPQTSWASVWPPPQDWERSAAAVVEAQGSVLALKHARADLNYPQISRTYEWRGNVLHGTVSWSDARFQGIHILQIPATAVVRVKRKVTPELPFGYLLLPIFRRDKALADREASPAVTKTEGDAVTLRGAAVTEKLGVYPQTIVAEIGDYRLTLRRGSMSGMSSVAPDQGMMTQVFLGSEESVFTEIEQLTPLGDGGVSISEILIEPGLIGGSVPPGIRNPVRRQGGRTERPDRETVQP